MLGVVVGALSVGTFFTTALTFMVARLVVTPPRGRTERTRVLDVDEAGSTITLARTADSSLPGVYGLWFSLDSGHLKLGPILSQTASTVTRRIVAVDFGDLATAKRGRFSGWVYHHPRELGVPFSDTPIETAAGSAPAWTVPAEHDAGKWAVLVHGRGVKRAEALRAVPVFRSLGYTSLIVSWRNDGEAPASADGRYRLGGSEWADVEAALDHVAASGGREVVLMGWSMGGAIALQTADRTRHAGLVRGVILESPVVDWAPTLDFQAREMRVPSPLRRAVIRLLGGRRMHRLIGLHSPLDFPALDFVTRATEIQAPVLILHSDDDGYVPSTASRELAALRPDLVTLHSWSGARHAKLWNYDPERFDREIIDWMVALPPHDRSATSEQIDSPRRR